MDTIKAPYRYAVAKRIVVDNVLYDAFTIIPFNFQQTFTQRNARKHLVKLLSEHCPQLYLLTLDNGEIINSKLYRYEDRRRPCPYCNQ